MSLFEPSLVRLALDELLTRYPGYDLVTVVWQAEGPWVLISLGQPSEVGQAWAIWRFAIWKTTGALHTMNGEGAVSDDPVWVPS